MDRLPPLKPSPHLYLKTSDGHHHYINLSWIVAAWWSTENNLWVLYANHPDVKKWVRGYGDQIMDALKMYHEAQ